jgi:hypothetical protein
LPEWPERRLPWPSWAEMVVVVADVAYASKAKIQLMRQSGY